MHAVGPPALGTHAYCKWITSLFGVAHDHSNRWTITRCSLRRHSQRKVFGIATVRHETNQSFSIVAQSPTGDSLHICPTDIEPSPGFYTNHAGAGPGTYFIHLLQPVPFEAVSLPHNLSVLVQLLRPSDANRSASAAAGHELVQRNDARVQSAITKSGKCIGSNPIR